MSGPFSGHGTRTARASSTSFAPASSPVASTTPGRGPAPSSASASASKKRGRPSLLHTPQNRTRPRRARTDSVGAGAADDDEAAERGDDENTGGTEGAREGGGGGGRAVKTPKNGHHTPARSVTASASRSQYGGTPSSTGSSIRRVRKDVDGTDLWTEEMDQILRKGLELIPQMGRRSVTLPSDNSTYGRVGLVGEYLRRQTGKIRNRTQTASHLVIARKHALKEGDRELVDLIDGIPLPSNQNLYTLDFEALLGPDHHPESFAAAARENNKVKALRTALNQQRKGDLAGGGSPVGSPSASSSSAVKRKKAGSGGGGLNEREDRDDFEDEYDEYDERHASDRDEFDEDGGESTPIVKRQKRTPASSSSRRSLGAATNGTIPLPSTSKTTPTAQRQPPRSLALSAEPDLQAEVKPETEGSHQARSREGVAATRASATSKAKKRTPAGPRSGSTASAAAAAAPANGNGKSPGKGKGKAKEGETNERFGAVAPESSDLSSAEESHDERTDFVAPPTRRRRRRDARGRGGDVDDEDDDVMDEDKEVPPPPPLVPAAAVTGSSKGGRLARGGGGGRRDDGQTQDVDQEDKPRSRTLDRKEQDEPTRRGEAMQVDRSTAEVRPPPRSLSYDEAEEHAMTQPGGGGHVVAAAEGAGRGEPTREGGDDDEEDSTSTWFGGLRKVFAWLG
ncbi:hypothetical protein JCM10212_001558 [Sporobolomyces blumeae]